MKQKTKRNLGYIALILATGLIVGGISAITKGFTECDFNSSSSTEIKDTRKNLRITNLETEDRTSTSMGESVLVEYLNNGLGENVDPIFEKVPYVAGVINLNYVFKGDGGMKFGTSNNLGYFNVKLIEDYTFNCVKIKGRNYSTLGNNDLYSCDNSSIVVNEAEAQEFGTNELNRTLIAPLEEKTFKFEEMQKALSVSVLGKRAIIYTIELWTE